MFAKYILHCIGKQNKKARGRTRKCAAEQENTQQNKKMRSVIRKQQERKLAKMAEYDISKMVGLKVKHVRFGKGIVTNAEKTYLCIDFGNCGMKKFQYPDAFENFLTTDNEKINAQIAADFEIRKEENDYIHHKKTLEVYESVEALGKRKAVEHEQKMRQKIEKQYQAKRIREQRMQHNNSSAAETNCKSLS